MLLEFKVVPNARCFALKPEGGKWKAWVDAPPEQNKANRRLLAKLGEILGRQVALVSGAGSRKKIIKVEGDAEVLRLLEKAARE